MKRFLATVVVASLIAVGYAELLGLIAQAIVAS
jgi:hypothetical protein